MLRRSMAELLVLEATGDWAAGMFLTQTPWQALYPFPGGIQH